MAGKNEILKEISLEHPEREFILTRLLKAPRELVYRVWTQPEHVMHWWGPAGFTNTIQHMEVKEGGEWTFIMHGPDGTDFPNRIEFLEVVEQERLVYIHGSGQENDPNQFIVSVSFVEVGEHTRVTLRALFPTAEKLRQAIERSGAMEGGKQTMDRLEAYLEHI
jgi:uncharacterized protein YndB with AHSA1/START domain